MAVWGLDSLLKTEVNIYMHICFQLQENINQDPLTNHVDPIPIQSLHHITIIAAAYRDVEIQATCTIIILILFFLLLTGKYTTYNI